MSAPTLADGIACFDDLYVRSALPTHQYNAMYRFVVEVDDGRATNLVSNTTALFAIHDEVVSKVLELPVLSTGPSGVSSLIPALSCQRNV